VLDVRTGAHVVPGRSSRTNGEGSQNKQHFP
jgi:hypothetical protein